MLHCIRMPWPWYWFYCEIGIPGIMDISFLVKITHKWIWNPGFVLRKKVLLLYGPFRHTFLYDIRLVMGQAAKPQVTIRLLLLWPFCPIVIIIPRKLGLFLHIFTSGLFDSQTLMPKQNCPHFGNEILTYIFTLSRHHCRWVMSSLIACVHLLICPSIFLFVCSSRMTLLLWLFSDFIYQPKNGGIMHILIYICRSLVTLAMLSQFLRVPWNFEIFHDSLFHQVWGTMLLL